MSQQSNEDEVEVEEPEGIDVIEMPDVSDISFNFDFDSNAPKMSRRQMKKAIKKQMKELEKQMTKYMIENYHFTACSCRSDRAS